MSFLSPTPITLRGGCYCNAIKYAINVPALSDRPIILPASTTTPQGYPEKDIRAPGILIDHCDKCRRIAGAFIQAWFICPQSWVTWDLQLRSPTTQEEARITLPTPSVVGPRHPETEKTYVSLFISSENVHRTFCSNCGSNLTYARVPGRDPKNPTLDITLGSFERESLEEGGVKPDRHVWWGSGIGWIKDLLRDGDVTLCKEEGKRLLRHEKGSIGAVVSEEME